FFVNHTAPPEIYTLSLTTLFRSTSTHTNRSAFGVSSERSRGFESGSGSTANTNVEKFDRVTGSSKTGQQVDNLRYGTDQTRSSEDRKSTRLNSSHVEISYAVFCL